MNSKFFKRFLSDKWLRRIASSFIMIIILAISVLFGINQYVIDSTKSRILSLDQVINKQYDCILVLGAGVWAGNKPSPMLEDRLIKGIELYNANVSDRLLMSGDHGRVEYDEVNVMKNYAKSKGISSSDIFMDHAGFSTYDSLYRAREIFKTKRILIVTQEYHLYRAIYIARQLGLDADGVAAEKIDYSGQWFRDLREILARNKDYFKTMLRAKASILGSPIPIDGDGDATND